MNKGLFRIVLALLAATVLALVSCENPAAGPGDAGTGTVDLKVEAEVAGDTASVKWDPPTDESQVKEYIVRLKDKDGNQVGADVPIRKAGVSGGKYSHTFTGLTIGNYTVEVIVVKSDGNEASPQGPKDPVEIVSIPPSAPSGLTIAGHFFDQNNPDKQTVKLTWTAPASTGIKAGGTAAALTGYAVYWAEGSAVDKTSALKEVIAPSGDSLATELTVAGHTLDASRAYAFIVTASSDAGDLASGGSVKVLKPALDFAVKDLVAEIKDSTKPNAVTASWSALTNNPALKAYKVHFIKQGDNTRTSATVSQGAGTISHVENLGPGEYAVEVTVIRTDDTESRPQRYSGTVQVQSAASPPQVPSGLTIAGHFFDENNPDKQTVKLSWTAPTGLGTKTDNSPAVLTGYTVYWAEGSAVDKTSNLKETIAPVGGSLATELTVAGHTLDASKAYAFIVTASNDAGLESGGGTAVGKPALDFAVKDLAAAVDATNGSRMTVSWSALTNNPALKAYKVYFKRGSETVRSPQVAQGTGTISHSENLPDGAYSIEVTVLRTDDTESQAVGLTGTVAVNTVSFVYKDDAALKAHNGKFSLGDFDGARLFKASGLGAYAGTTIKQKVSVKEGETVRHAGTAQNLVVDSSGDSALFGISGMSYGSWAAIADNADAAITVELTESGGTVIASTTFTKTKTPDGSIYTWRDLQNMKHKLEGSFELRNDVAFPAKDAEGFGSFAPVGSSASLFTGKLDGKGKTVTGLYVSQTGNDAGLFGSMGSGGEVRDLKLVDPSVSGASNVGAFAGTMSGSAALRRVEASLATGTMVEGSGDNVGGLAGSMAENSTALVIGAASGAVKGAEKVGGLVGHIGSGGSVTGTASGSVSGTGSLGGLAGSASTGASAGTARGYWDETSTGRSTSAGGGAALSKIADVTYKGGRYFDGTAEVFDDADWHKYFRLPKEAGKWPQLVMDASVPPAAPALNAIAAGDISTANDKMTIDLSWTAPSNAGKKADGAADASVTKYTVFWRSLGADAGSRDLTPAAQGGAVPTSASIADLNPADTYTFTAAATSDAGRDSLPASDKTALGTRAGNILGFAFRKADNSGLAGDTAATINEQTRTIAAQLSGVAGVDSLKPTITIPPGASVSPASGAAKDFSAPVTYTLTASDGSTRGYTVGVVTTNYKSDAALKEHSDKFSLGDYDNARLLKVAGLNAHKGTTIRQKVSVKEGGTVRHAGTTQDLIVDAQGSTAYFGISGMTYATWAGITDNADVTITFELSTVAGAQIMTETLTKKKTPDGSIYTWRDLQNMEDDKDGDYKIQNDFGFPAPNTQGFDTFVPVAGWTVKFTGTLDGNKKTISDFHAVRAATEVGIFAVMGNGGEVKDLKLLDPTTSGTSAVGTFAGSLDGSASLKRVEASRTTGTMVTGTSIYIGGLVGYVHTTATGVIIGTTSGEVNAGNASQHVGGLVGRCNASIIIVGAASGKVIGNASTGGIVGTYTATPGRVHGYWDETSTTQSSSMGGTGAVGISAIANVSRTVTGGVATYTDTKGNTDTGDDVVVFNDTEFLKYYDLPTEGGKWPTLKQD